jgi:hypothetical protein
MTNTLTALPQTEVNSIIITTTLMKDGTEAQVNLDDLPEFLAANKDNIQTQKFTPRRPRVNTK